MNDDPAEASEMSFPVLGCALVALFLALGFVVGIVAAGVLSVKAFE